MPEHYSGWLLKLTKTVIAASPLFILVLARRYTNNARELQPSRLTDPTQ